MHLVGVDVARQPDVLVDRAAIEQLQVAARQALEKRGHFAGGEIGRAARDALGGGGLRALDQIVAVLQRQVVVGVDVEPPEQLFFPSGQRVGADRLDVGERHQAQELQPLLGADQRGELADDLRILGVAPERHLRHPQVMADEEQDRLARARRGAPIRRAAARPGGRSPTAWSSSPALPMSCSSSARTSSSGLPTVAWRRRAEIARDRREPLAVLGRIREPLERADGQQRVLVDRVLVVEVAHDAAGDRLERRDQAGQQAAVVHLRQPARRGRAAAPGTAAARRGAPRVGRKSPSNSARRAAG